MIISDCTCGKRCRAGSDKCASCEALERKAARVQPSDNNSPINKKSEKQSYWEKKYFARLRTWKRGKKCLATFPHDCSNVITCHHMYSRSVNSFHDEWAAENNVPELMDERFWMPLCLAAHDYITEHSEFAWRNGYSFKRVSDPIFRK